MAPLRVLAVLDDVHPKALIDVDGSLYAVEHPAPTLDPSRKLPPARLKAAIAKHGYVELAPPVIVADLAALAAYLEERTKSEQRR